MSACIVARTAVIALREQRRDARKVTVVFPARWSRSALLRYVRREHPNETARIVEWRSSVGADSWEPLLWICNPEGFASYRKGVLYERASDINRDLGPDAA